MRRDEDVRVLYIVGWGRSGSTLVGNILNECDGFFHTGELNYIWENGLLRKRPCGCGRPLTTCEIWSSVLSEVFEGGKPLDPSMVIQLRDRAPQNKAVLGDLLKVRPIAWESHRDYLDALARMYRAIRTASGCDVIIDSTKSPAYGYLLGQVPGLKVHYLHLVRDARATAFSWQRTVRRQDGNRSELMEQRTLYENGKRWMVTNAVSELIGMRSSDAYMRVRYEDFVQRPIQTIREIAAFTGRGVDMLPFVAPQDVVLDTNHTVWGNPKRVARGVLHVKRDDTWLHEMEPALRWSTTALTWPLLLRYGYLPARYDNVRRRPVTTTTHPAS